MHVPFLDLFTHPSYPVVANFIRCLILQSFDCALLILKSIALGFEMTLFPSVVI